MAVPVADSVGSAVVENMHRPNEVMPPKNEPQVSKTQNDAFMAQLLGPAMTGVEHFDYALPGSATSLAGYPPAYIENCENDDLRASGEAFARQLAGLAHDEIIGRSEGCVVSTVGGLQYLVFRPLLNEYMVTMGWTVTARTSPWFGLLGLWQPGTAATVFTPMTS